MSLSAAEILVESTDAETVETVAAESLVDWAAGVGALPPDEDGSDAPVPERHLVLLPPTGGWMALIEEDGRPDRSLARALRDRLGTRTAVLELDGRRLRASLEIFLPGGDSIEWNTPTDDDDAMPAYEDAEAEACRRVAELGVPDVLAAPDWESLVDTTLPEAQGCRLDARAGEELLDKLVIPFGELPALGTGIPRTHPDLWVADEEGRARVVESRRVSGRPDAAAAQALVAVEDRQLARIVPVLARAADAPQVPEVLFGYEGSDDDEALEQAIESARESLPAIARRRREPLLSLRGIEASFREAIVALRTGIAAGRTLGRRVELRHASMPAGARFVDLDDLWDAYFRDPDDDGIFDRYARQALAPEAAACSFDPGSAMPLLLGQVEGLAALAVRPFVRGVWVGLGIDTGTALVPVTRGMLAHAGLGFEDALEAAIANLERATEENDSFVIYEQPEGVTVTAEFPDPFTAARILSEAVRWHVAHQLGDGCAVAVPTRDLLLAAEPTREARGWLERETARRFAESDVPLTRAVWRVENGELAEDGEAPAQEE